MKNIKRLGNRISVNIVPDKDGYIGRECPKNVCGKYFKVKPGTGIKGSDIPCHCPYCGHSASHEYFRTQDQVKYLKSVALRKVADAFSRDARKLEFDSKLKGGFGINLRLKSKGRTLPSLHRYFEKDLETNVKCENCTLEYKVHGTVNYCPDCGQPNSIKTRKRFKKNIGRLVFQLMRKDL